MHYPVHVLVHDNRVEVLQVQDIGIAIGTLREGKGVRSRGGEELGCRV